MCVSGGKNSPKKSILWSNFVFGKPKKNAYFEIFCCCSFGFLRGTWISKPWMMFILFHPFCSCENLPDFHARARTCTESWCQQDHQLPRVQKREIQPPSALWPRAQMPCVCPTLLFLGQLSCRNCKPNARAPREAEAMCLGSELMELWMRVWIPGGGHPRQSSFLPYQSPERKVGGKREEGNPVHIYQYGFT